MVKQRCTRYANLTTYMTFYIVSENIICSINVQKQCENDDRLNMQVSVKAVAVSRTVIVKVTTGVA